MLKALRDAQLSQGAILAPEEGVPISFGNDAVAWDAAQTGVAVYDACHWGRIEVSDADRLTFLHNQSTNSFKLRQPGEVCDTVFVTSTARTLDLATAYILPESVLLVVSPGRATKLIAVLDRYIFFADRVKLTDVTVTTSLLQLVGPGSEALVEHLGGAMLVGQPPGTHQTVTIAGHLVRLAVGSGLSTPGYSLMGDSSAAAGLWQVLINAGVVPLGETVWQQLRVRQGRPWPGAELTDAYNPLEAGLWHTVSFNKGCYIGQETIARLDTYQGVKQQLWGFELAQPVDLGSPIDLEGRKVGTVTSLIDTPQGWRGLAYVKTTAGGAGLAVQIGEQSTHLLDLPYLTRRKQGE
jgi:folate-binding protein YgfZ